jgi:hypothetical protein
MAEPGTGALWAALADRGLLATDLSAEAFASLYGYAQGLAARGIVPTPEDLLCPAVVRTGPATLRDLVAALADVPAPSGVEGPPPPPPDRLADLAGTDPFAPVLAGFVRRARSALCGDDPARPVFGLMRDGGLLADAMAATYPGAATRRLWLSRRLCLIAALRGADDREGLTNLLVRARGHPARVAEALADLGVDGTGTPHGLRADDPVDGTRLPRLLDALAHDPRRRRVEARIRAVRTGLLAHLRGAGAFDGPDLALLDLGYAATIQTALARILAAEGIPVRLRGAYLVTTPGAVWARRAGGDVRGDLAAFGAPSWFTTPFVRHREVIETLCASGDGPLLDYGVDGAPVLGPPGLPVDQHDAVRRRQAATLEVIARLPAGAEPDPDMARALCLRLLVAPTAAEAAEIGDWLYDDPLAVGPPRRLTDGGGGTAADLLGASREALLWPAAAAARRFGLDPGALARAWAGAP